MAKPRNNKREGSGTTEVPVVISMLPMEKD